MINDGRFLKLYAIDENLYCAGSPVLILAGSLLKDTETGKILGQFKFLNVSSMMIKALMIRINAYDISSRQVDGISEFQYLDLNVHSGVSFGDQTAVFLPEVTTRSIKVECTCVVFQDGTTWNMPENAQWCRLPEQQPLFDVLNRQHIDQYRRDVCLEAKWVPLEYDDLWLCTCSHINPQGSSCCRGCNEMKTTVFEALNEETLEQHYVEFEEERRIKEETEKELKAKKAQTKKKRAILIAVASVIVAVILLFTAIIPGINAAKQHAIYKEQQEFISTVKSSVENGWLLDLYLNGDTIISANYSNERINGDQLTLNATYQVVRQGFSLYYNFKIIADMTEGTYELEFIDVTS